MEIRENIDLKEFTTINLGGKARYFSECKSEEDIVESLLFAHREKLKTFILGGGSNVIFSDEGYDGLVLKVKTEGINIVFENEDFSEVEVCAGTDWDSFVEWSVAKGLSGVECLSGIPGSTGATPVQNVGAYGQEAGESIVKIFALDKSSLLSCELPNGSCEFKYRSSIFKTKFKDKYIITKILFRLSAHYEKGILYPDLKALPDITNGKFDSLNDSDKLKYVRNEILKIRKSKSMIYDKTDINSVSCGSFFMNPVIESGTFQNLKDAYPELSKAKVFTQGDRVKISAANLIELAGFKKGYKYKNSGISEKHSLALINISGNTQDLKTLAEMIVSQVKEKTGIILKFEPIFVK